MTKFRSAVYFLITFMFFSVSAFAKCNFQVNIGDKIADVEEVHGPAFEISEITSVIELDAEEICPNETLGDSYVKFIFLDGELASISIIVENEQGNKESQKLLLYKYVESNYGEISNTPDVWRGFMDWEQNDKIIVYKKMPFNQTLEEELSITNEKYLEVMNLYHDEGEF